MSLELYSKVEHLLGIEEATQHLHNLYIETLRDYDVKTLLDLGCGTGSLMKKLEDIGIECDGIDLSASMVEKARKKALKVEHKSICEIENKYDVIISVFDVVNFIDKDEIDRFMNCIYNSLNENGLFIFDINSLYGFQDVAQGAMVTQDDNLFLSVDALFENEKLHTKFTLFTRGSNSLYTKQESDIIQYYYPLKFFKSLKKFSVEQKSDIDLYDLKDKILIVLKKV